jgi:hypothetical protein
MPTELILPFSILFGLVNFGLIAGWYVIPALETLSRERALTPLLLFHAFRYVGLAFLIPGVVAGSIAPAFTQPAAYGDLAAALLALLAVVALRQRWPYATVLVWVFNIVGTLDLLNALFQRVRHVPTGDLGGAYLIPALYVPALLVSHYVIFRLLAMSSEGCAGSGDALGDSPTS